MPKCDTTKENLDASALSLTRVASNYGRSLARKNLVLAVFNELLNVTVPVMLESVKRLLQSKRLVDHSMA